MTQARISGQGWMPFGRSWIRTCTGTSCRSASSATCRSRGSGGLRRQSDDPGMPRQGPPPRPGAPGRSRDPRRDRRAREHDRRSARPPAPSTSALKNVRNIVAVGSGKGGVGKSTVASNIAACSREAARVGLLDADIYGPSIPIMMRGSRPAEPRADNVIEPGEAHLTKVMSMGYLTPGDQPSSGEGRWPTRRSSSACSA